MSNPELRRNLWLEFTPHRLLAMPAILAITFLALAAAEDAVDDNYLGVGGLLGFCLITLIWGTRLAAGSILDEVIDKTWDWQRLSTLSPWTITAGKLFGATAYSWYGGLICLAVHFVTTQPANFSPGKAVISAVLFAIVLHATAIAFAVQLSRRNGGDVLPGRRSTSIVLLFVLANIFPFALILSGRNLPTLTWYGAEFEFDTFVLVSVGVIAFWAVLAAYRAMCQALSVRTTPVAWVSFILFACLYTAGFVPDSVLEFSYLTAVLLAGFGWAVGMTYLMLFIEPTGPQVIRLLVLKAQRGEWRRFFEELPCWPVGWLCALFFALGLLLAGAGQPLSGLGRWWAAPLPMALLLARDAAIVMFFAASSKPKRVLGAALIYIVVLDWILPALFSVSGSQLLVQLVLPIGFGNPWLQTGIALVHVAVAVGLAYRRISAMFAKPDGLS